MKTTNPDHNIWKNNGTWWCHFTVHHNDYTKERVRRSLQTANRAIARRRRDRLMATVEGVVRPTTIERSLRHAA